MAKFMKLPSFSIPGETLPFARRPGVLCRMDRLHAGALLHGIQRARASLEDEATGRIQEVVPGVGPTTTEVIPLNSLGQFDGAVSGTARGIGRRIPVGRVMHDDILRRSQCEGIQRRLCVPLGGGYHFCCEWHFSLRTMDPRALRSAVVTSSNLTKP